ncbi:hypothetical protein, partial [Klebsiella pneumoniae]|uniref:hypothetical protein n=1 Tax=Klebsiella pneumoniae TaxID=573 RepID=UPI0030D98DE9
VLFIFHVKILINYICWSFWRFYDRQGDSIVIFDVYYRYIQQHSTAFNSIQQHSTTRNDTL